MMGPSLRVTPEGLIAQTVDPYRICLHGLKGSEGWHAEVTRSVVACELGISVAQHNKVCFSLTLQSNEGLGDGGSDPVPSFTQGSRALSIRRCCSFQHPKSSQKRKSEWRMHGRFLRSSLEMACTSL